MRRIIEKKAILPIKWWMRYQEKLRNTEMREANKVMEKRLEMEEKLHDCKRKNDQRGADHTQGFIQALDWICHQEQNEHKQ